MLENNVIADRFSDQWYSNLVIFWRQHQNSATVFIKFSYQLKIVPIFKYNTEDSIRIQIILPSEGSTHIQIQFIQ